MRTAIVSRIVTGDALVSYLGVLSSDVSERRTSTGNGLFALLDHDFEQMFGQIVSVRVKTLSGTDLVASRHLKREKGSLPVDVRGSKTLLLKLPIGQFFPFLPGNSPRSLRESQLVPLSLSLLKWRLLLNIILTFVPLQAVLAVTNSSHCDPRVS